MSRRIHIVPDVHGRPFWKDVLTASGDNPVVFLGDYLDAYPNDVIFHDLTKEGIIASFEDIIRFKQENSGRVTLLLGNHDCEYMYGRDVCDCRTDNDHYDEIQALFRTNKDLFQVAAEFFLRGRRFVFTHAGIHPEWMDRHVPGWTIENMVAELNELNRQALATDFPEETDFARALAEADPERGGTDDFASPIWADAERLNAGHHLADIVQVVGHTGIPPGDPVITKDVLYTDCRQVLTLSERGVLRTLDRRKCVSRDRDPFDPELPDWRDRELFNLDCFERPYCRSCGSRNIYIRAGMMADHWYCTDCGKDQIL